MKAHQTGTFADCARAEVQPHAYQFVPFRAGDGPGGELMRSVDRFPFVPDRAERLDQDCYEAFNIQVQGLMRRLKATNGQRIVIGVSGGIGKGSARSVPGVDIGRAIQRLAAEGLRLTNMNMEAQCTPSRSSILTGRFDIRSGTHSVPFGGVADGLTQWEVTLAEALSAQGYATALYGKWHLGSSNGHLPNDQGFDEWYGIPRTTDEALWTEVMPPEQIMQGRKGEPSREDRLAEALRANLRRRKAAAKPKKPSN